MDLEVNFSPWQATVYEDSSRFKVVSAGRRCGKSYLAAWTLLLAALGTDNPKSWTFYVAPTQGQARQILWKALLEIGHKVIAKAHINNLDIELINGQTIGLRGADRPDTMRGVSLNYLVMDEYADMKPDVWEEILQPALSDMKGDALFIGTPKGRNHFYELYKNAELKPNDSWEEWSSYHFTSYDNPFLDPKEIDRAKKTMSSYAFRQEFMASFEAKGSAMFNEEWIEFGAPFPQASTFIAIDLAGFEELGKKNNTKRLDDTAIVVVDVSDQGEWYVRDIISGRWTLDETAMRIFSAVDKYKPSSVGIEKGIAKQAVISPLMELQRRFNRYFRIEELTHGNKKKIDRVMWALQGRFENGLIKLARADWNAKFLDQLFQFPDPLTHDDLVDALAYIDQLATVTYLEAIEIDDWEPSDPFSGY